jgi:hypothetical protein
MDVRLILLFLTDWGPGAKNQRQAMVQIDRESELRDRRLVDSASRDQHRTVRAAYDPLSR